MARLMGVRLTLIVLFSLVLGAQTYPPALPRAGATKLLENERVVVWDVTWPKGKPTPFHLHIYDMTGVYVAPGDRVITAEDGSKRPITTAAGGIIWQLKGITHIEEGTSEEPLRAKTTGGPVLIIEPIARSVAPWWDKWTAAFADAGGSSAEWRFDVELPPLLEKLDRAAGLKHRELTGRTLWLSTGAGESAPRY